MPKQEKVEVTKELKERIAANQLTILTKYVGLNAGQATKLRRQLREAHVEYKVFKNTLAKRVLDELELGEGARFMDGPTAWAFSNDPVQSPKILKEFGKEVPFVEMTGGILEGKLITKAQLDVLAALPPREVLLSQVVGTIAAPLRNLAGVLNALPRNLVNVLDQIRKQKEEQGAAA